MPVYWGTTTQGTAAITAVPIWSSPTATGQTYLATSGLYQAMMNQATSCQTMMTQSALYSYYNSTTGDMWVEPAQYFALAQNRVTAYRARTEDERLAHDLARQQAQLAQAMRMRERQEALDRSRALLLEHLTPAQRATFEANRWFLVEGGKTKVKYRIRTEGYAGNIDVLNGGKVSHRLCGHCEGIPLHDHHLAQKLALEYDEERFLKIANRQAA